MSSDAEYAREIVEDEGVWGFVVYRCSYKSDGEWLRFLQILNDNVRESLEADDEEYLDLMDTLDWAVQETPELEGASKEEIRRRFRDWASEHADLSSPRSSFCIMVDQDCIDATLGAPAPPEYDSEHKAFVYIIDKNWRQRHYEDNVDGASGGGKDPADEGFDPLDGCRMDDVGWMKLAVSHVAPRAFSILDDPGWEGAYRRPPKVVRP
ncbi:hypothetical protein KVT40_007152 [Elsinoe batatas]|uniref:Uncharacterized protein n=1 Tax=Elsinoe batatas TaxID=2601811 RepID=A0A8K0L0J1_9PEZI|nr:hypothetical protein KVT40_007152 [Elsinoe batatas]